MRRDLAKREIQSSFLSCEKDFETITRKLFIESKPYSEDLIRLLVLNTKDCLDDKESKVYNDIVKNMTVKDLRDKGYIRYEPRIKFNEFEEVKSYIIIGFDNFVTNHTNPQFRDCTVTLDIMCSSDYWDIGDYRLRPLKICGYVDGILNNSRLSGIGTLQFLGCNQLVLDDALAGYSLMFAAIHGTDDVIPDEDG